MFAPPPSIHVLWSVGGVREDDGVGSSVGRVLVLMPLLLYFVVKLGFMLKCCEVAPSGGAEASLHASARLSHELLFFFCTFFYIHLKSVGVKTENL